MLPPHATSFRAHRPLLIPVIGRRRGCGRTMARFEPRGSVSRPVVEWLSEGVRKRANLSDGDAGADRESAHGRDRSLIGAPRSRPSRDAGHHLPGSWFSRYSWTRTFLQSRNLLPKAPPGAHRRTRPRRPLPGMCCIRMHRGTAATPRENRRRAGPGRHLSGTIRE